MKKHIVVVSLIFTTLMFSQTKQTYNIGFLLDYKTPEIKPLLTLLQKEIKDVVGEDAIINFPETNVLINNYSIEKARANYNTLVNNDTDIIIAFGITNNEVVSKLKTHKKPTILFGSVNKDFNYFDDSKEISGISNFTYLVVPQSYEKDLSVLKEITSFTNVGIAVKEDLISILPFKRIFDKEATTLGFNYKIIPYNTSDDIVNDITSDIDAFYLASGFFLNKSDITKIATKLIDKKIPSFTSTSIEDVENGIMATNQSNDNINQFFRRIALSVESHISGENLSELPVHIDYNDKLTINHNTLERVGVSTKYSLIANTNFVGDFVVNALSEKKYNLLDVMNAVIGENLGLKSSKRNVELSEQDVKTSKSNYLPSVTASASGVYVDPDLAEISNGQNPEFSTSGNIALEQTLFSEAANANISIQKEVLKAQKETYNADKLDAIFNASNVYFNALILKANLQIQIQNLNLTKKNLQIAKQNFEAGQSGKTDVLRFTSERAKNTQALVEATNQLEQTYYTLNQLLNNSITLEIDVDEAELGEGILKNYNYQQLRDVIDDPKLRIPFVEYLVKVAKENAPEIKSLDYNLNATKRNIQLNSYGRFLPTLALRGQYNRDFNRWGKGSAPAPVLNDNYNIAVNLSIPIFNRTQTNINRQTAKIQEDQLAINKENIELSIEANVNNAILDLINQIANIEISKISEIAAKESLELTQVSYSSGAVTIVQLLDAQNNYLAAQQSQITAVYNYLLSSMQLERYISHFFLLNSPEENQAFIQGFNDYLNNRK